MKKKIYKKLLVIIALGSLCVPLWSDSHDSGTRFSHQSVPDFGPFADELADVQRIIFTLVNQEREARGLQPLIKHDELSYLARLHSVDMGLLDYVSHNDPDGVTPEERIYAALSDRYYLTGMLENIAFYEDVYGFVQDHAAEIAETFVADWMSSPGHRENILTSWATHSGVGLYLMGTKLYATQKFMQYIVRSEDVVPEQVSRDETAIMFLLNPRFIGNHDLVVGIDLPDSDAGWFVQPEWLNNSDFLVHLPVDRFGPGRYTIHFGNQGGTSTMMQEFPVLVE